MILKILTLKTRFTAYLKNRYFKSITECDKNAFFGAESSVQNLRNDKSGVKIGEGTFIRGELIIFPYGGNITIGTNCYVGEGTKIWSGEDITIGNNVMIGHYVNIIDFSHETYSVDRADGYKKLLKEGHPKEKGKIPTRKINIEDDVIIYAGSNIVMGTTIGKGSIVSAGSVVIKDVPPYSLVLGNPAKRIWKTK